MESIPRHERVRPTAPVDVGRILTTRASGWEGWAGLEGVTFLAAHEQADLIRRTLAAGQPIALLRRRVRHLAASPGLRDQPAERLPHLLSAIVQRGDLGDALARELIADQTGEPTLRQLQAAASDLEAGTPIGQVATAHGLPRRSVADLSTALGIAERTARHALNIARQLVEAGTHQWPERRLPRALAVASAAP